MTSTHHPHHAASTPEQRECALQDAITTRGGTGSIWEVVNAYCTHVHPVGGSSGRWDPRHVADAFVWTLRRMPSTEPDYIGRSLARLVYYRLNRGSDNSGTRYLLDHVLAADEITALIGKFGDYAHWLSVEQRGYRRPLILALRDHVSTINAEAARHYVESGWFEEVAKHTLDDIARFIVGPYLTTASLTVPPATGAPPRTLGRTRTHTKRMRDREDAVQLRVQRAMHE